MITYYLQVDDRPKTEGAVFALFRWVDNDDGLFTEWYNRTSGKWEDHPGLMAATGIGGDESFVSVTKSDAEDVLVDWDIDLDVLEEGGPGSGWFAPPKGTHGSQTRNLEINRLYKPQAWPLHGEWQRQIDEQELEWSEIIKEEWEDEYRADFALEAINHPGEDTYVMWHDGELVAAASMSRTVTESDAAQLYPLNNKYHVGWVATKRGGYGEEMLMHLRAEAAELGSGIYLTSVPDAEGFYEKVGGTRLIPGRPMFFWEVLEEKEWTSEEIAAAEPKHGCFASPDGQLSARRRMAEGGKGSGWFAPPRGTHGLGSQGGKTEFEKSIDESPVTSTERLMSGITRPEKVTLENGQQALWKEHRANGTRHDAYSEVATYELAGLLNPHEQVVPEVVNAERDGRYQGTYQEWIPGKASGGGLGATIDAVNDPRNRDRVATMVAIDAIILNSDRHDGNFIVDDDGLIWATDHGHAYWDRTGEFNTPMTVGGPWRYMELQAVEYRVGLSYFKFPPETVGYWRTITKDQFSSRILPQVERAGKDGENTRVNVDGAWFNFQKLIEDGGVQK